eukprot:CAMPEP_0197233996 /NCGR_PEP_ID=MMETSP1429-20130617/1871_1 /TAXON_ID=49237 /ORGANISM="Chaetoceros  sp., Strain UNC1202" /LENGTH=168 /DNA_ID=CAMNT_0042692319 /DNA_START=371 /DNA_END=874 /DNA_ORIENTATION=-
MRFIEWQQILLSIHNDDEDENDDRRNDAITKTDSVERNPSDCSYFTNMEEDDDDDLLSQPLLSPVRNYNADSYHDDVTHKASKSSTGSSSSSSAPQTNPIDYNHVPATPSRIKSAAVRRIQLESAFSTTVTVAASKSKRANTLSPTCTTVNATIAPLSTTPSPSHPSW